MRVIVGAPVAGRAWALARWFECLERQTVKPDGFAFIYSDSDPDDGTRTLLNLGASMGPVCVETAPEAYIPRERRQQDLRHCLSQLAMLRNRMLALALKMGADAVLSLDTDVFLTDTTTIEKLLHAITFRPLASPVVFLHQGGEQAEVFNAAWWRTSDVGSPTRAWERLSGMAYREGSYMVPGLDAIEVDIPMAAVMMRRHVAESCSYAYHEAGEDMGFAQCLDRHGYRTAWLLGTRTEHVMQPVLLDSMVPA